MDIPIVIICYNNYRYVKNTLLQILNINKDYYKNIIVVNNNSSCANTIEYLKNVDVRVLNNAENTGPWISHNNNKHIYDILPEKFILTDPDLKLNKNIPSNFIEILACLSDKYRAYKIGMALDITDHELFFLTTNYVGNESIYEWEKKFWDNKVDVNDNEYELYYAGIDTTFCLINKNNISFSIESTIRVAGNFVAKHIPWYRENEIYNVYNNYINNTNTTDISTMAKTITAYIEDKYLRIYKNNELFLIENNIDNPNLSFWKDVYSYWDNTKFEVFDKYLSKDKVFIDIGGWIAATPMYGSRKSKHIYAIEADNIAFNYMENNMKANCENNYTLINKAIYNIDNKKVNFSKNLCQIYPDGIISKEYYIVETITLETIIKNYEIDVANISLINVDIKGGEENILNDLFDIYLKFNVPLCINFNYYMWNDKNLERFPFLSKQDKNDIASNESASILFLNTINNKQ
jgi:FkbM family methyltransferase